MVKASQTIDRPLFPKDEKSDEVIKRLRKKQLRTTNYQLMKNEQLKTDSGSVFLTGAILFANLDYSGLAEYALKAAIGGAVWMAFKLATDYIAQKIKK